MLMLSDAPAKAYSGALSPSKIVAKHHDRDILKKSQRKNKYIFSFPGLLAPISGGKIGELKDLRTKNSIIYTITSSFMAHSNQVTVNTTHLTFSAGNDTYRLGIMATKPLTSEAIAITEKKMDMTLGIALCRIICYSLILPTIDDIIRMSKSNPSKAKKQRLPNKSQGFLNNVALDKSAKVQRFMDSRFTLRQGALAKKRSNFQRNQFPLATEAARKAGFAPVHIRTFSRARMRARMMSANMNANTNTRIVAPSV